MKSLPSSLALTSLLVGAIAPLAAQSEPTPAVPALVSTVNLQITLTTTGDETSKGPETKKVHTANFDVTRLNTKDFIALLNEKYHLVDQPKDFDLVAVLVESETTSDYRFYLRNKKKNGTPAYVYLSPEVLDLTVDAAALSYTDVQNGDTLLSSKGSFKYAITLDSAGFETQGIATGKYTTRDVTVEGVTSQLTVPGETKATTSGHYTENGGTADAQTFIAETRWVFTPYKAVDLNDYPAPPVTPAPTP